MVAVEILDEDDDMQAQGHDDSVDLGVVFEVSLPRLVSDISDRTEARLACLRVDRKSIIFCTARVPCMFSEMLTKSCATDSQMTLRCSSVAYSSSFWQR